MALVVVYQGWPVTWRPQAESCGRGAIRSVRGWVLV